MNRRLSLDQIIFDAGTQIRAAISESVVAHYADCMTEGALFPAIVVFHDGNQYYLADGFHRGLAAKRIGFKDIEADVHAGTKSDALWFALGSNRTNGHQMTGADKRHAIIVALQTWPDRSINQISEQIGVNQRYASGIKIEVSGTTNLPKRVTGKDGKSYPASRKAPEHTAKGRSAKTKAERDQRWDRAREMAEQGYTSRQIADEFGLGIEGVRVRMRERGIDVPADRVVGKSRRHDSNRIVDQMVSDAENLTADVNLIDFTALDSARIAQWVERLWVSKRALEVFIRRLSKKEGKTNGEAA